MIFINKKKLCSTNDLIYLKKTLLTRQLIPSLNLSFGTKSINKTYYKRINWFWNLMKNYAIESDDSNSTADWYIS